MLWVGKAAPGFVGGKISILKFSNFWLHKPHLKLRNIQRNNCDYLLNFLMPLHMCEGDSILPFTDSRVRGWLLLDNYIPTFAFTVMYLLIVWMGPRYMKNRQPYSCRALLVPYNLCLTLLSLYMFYEVGLSYRKYVFIWRGHITRNLKIWFIWMYFEMWSTVRTYSEFESSDPVQKEQLLKLDRSCLHVADYGYVIRNLPVIVRCYYS